jgi:hypothetical protein
MYLVELRPGKEELYRTGDELAAAIRSGDVDVHSRIYHRATSKWISVTLHPQYKAIVAARPAAAPARAPDPVDPMESHPLEHGNWTFFNDSADSLAGAHDPTESESNDKDDDSNPPWRRPLALSVTGGLLILGLQLAHSGPRPPWAETGEKPAAEIEVTPAAAPAPEPAQHPAASTVSLVSNRGTEVDVWAGSDADDEAPFVTTSGSSSSAGAVREPTPSPAPEVESAKPAKPALPAAPRFRPKLLSEVLARPTPAPTAASDALTLDGLMQRRAAAYDSTLARLASGMRVVRLNQLFAPARLSPSGGVTETRMSLAGVANFVRIYRQRQATIEREYQDTFSVASKDRSWSTSAMREWYAKPNMNENPTLAALTSSLLNGIDSLLGVLDDQAGTYKLDRNTIRFEDAGAKREYTVLRQRIMETVESAKAAGGRERPGPMSYLLQAIGTTRLPVAI